MNCLVSIAIAAIFSSRLQSGSVNALNVEDGHSYHGYNGSDDYHRIARKVSPAVSESFQQLKEKLQSLPSDLKPKLDHINNRLTNTFDKNTFSEANMKKVQGVMTSVITNWDSLTGNDSTKIAKGIVDIVASVSAFIPPPAGPIVSTLMSLVSNILGIFTGQNKQKSMAEVMQEILSKELKAQYLEDMRAEIEGAVNALDINQVFLTGYVGGKLTDRDFQFMLRQFDMLTQIQLRGKLAYMIKKMAKSKKIDDAKDAVDMVERYVTLASMVEVLMHTMKSILDEDEDTKLSSHNLGMAIKSARDQTRDHLDFLRIPKVENALTVAQYDPATHPNVEKILDSLEVSIPEVPSDACSWRNRKTNSLLFYGSNLTEMFPASLDTLDIGIEIKSQLIIEKGSSYHKIRALGEVPQNVTEFYGVTSNPYLCTSYGCDLGCPSHDLSMVFVVFKAQSFWCLEPAQFRVYPFSDGGYMFIAASSATNPIWLDSKHSVPLLTSEKKEDWDEKNPEYVWLLDCEGDPPTLAEALGLQWSSAGPVPGKHCVQMLETASPHTWNDNYICFNRDYGVRWNSAGPIGGMDCTQLLEIADPHTWSDNYLCVPNGSPWRFLWNSAGPIAGKSCVQLLERADPHTWSDNYLCVEGHL